MPGQPPTQTLSSDTLHADDGYKVIILSCFFSVLCIVVVIARFIARRQKKADLWWDDWLCIPALFFALSLNAVNITMVQVAGVGRHTASFGEEAPVYLSRWARILYVELLFYSFAIPLPKLVLLLLYIRIFSNPRFKLIVYATAAFITAWCPAVFFTDIFQCAPIAYAWDKSIRNGSCINVLAFFRYIAVPIVLSDFIVLVLPLPMIWQLHMTTRQKLALSGVFMLGSFGLIASIVRMVMFFRSNAFADPTWTAVTLLIWTMVEVEAVLIAACLPPLRPMFLSLWHGGARVTSRWSRVGNKTLESAEDVGAPGQKKGFSKIEDYGGIRRTWEVEMVPVEIGDEGEKRRKGTEP